MAPAIVRICVVANLDVIVAPNASFRPETCPVGRESQYGVISEKTRQAPQVAARCPGQTPPPSTTVGAARTSQNAIEGAFRSRPINRNLGHDRNRQGSAAGSEYGLPKIQRKHQHQRVGGS